MYWPLNFLLTIIIIVSPLVFLIFRSRRKSPAARLPPGPPGWPVIGNMLSLGSLPHRTLAQLRPKYGPVIWLKLGSVNTLVVQNAKSASELFKNHDMAFTDRFDTIALQSHGYNKVAVSASAYSTYWRLLRRIGTVEMFVNKKIMDTSSIRHKCVDDMIKWIDKEVDEGSGEIVLTRFVFLSIFNIMGNIILSCDLADPQSSSNAQDFYDAMMGIMEWAGTPNISDLFPWLAWLDLQGIKKKMDRDMGKALQIVSGFVNQRLIERQEGRESNKDFLDMLLDFEGSGKDEPHKLPEHDIKLFVLEMFLVGTETTSTTVEWVMTELLRNPASLTKVKAEIAGVIGSNGKLKETDTDHLHYMQAVIKETMRLHAPLPFLVPRRSIQETNYMGYDIPKNTQVFVNVWAIGRDPDSWDNALSFKAERFLGSDIDYNGNHFELIPFGAGRRVCIGIPLGQRMAILILASLLHKFDWELGKDVNLETLDMKEKLGITARKLEPLKVVPQRAKMNFD